MSSRSEVCVCLICKQKYFEPNRHTRHHVCGHCEILRSWAQDGTGASAEAAGEYQEKQRAKCIARRPRCADILKDV